MKLAFLWLDVKPSSAETFKNKTHMAFMLLQGIRVNQEVIEICNKKVIEILPERIIDKVLKCPQGIAKAEWHDLVFEQSVTRTERCLPFLPRRHAKEVIAIAHIELGEILGLAETIEEFRN
jgi:hypothetical protein